MSLDIYITNKTNYINLSNQYIQTGGIKSNKFEHNMWLNKQYFGAHHDASFRKKRLADFDQIVKKLSKHLIPKQKAEINPKLLKKYIGMHKKENRHIIEQIINAVQFIKFDEFYSQLCYQVNRFNDYLTEHKIKKYIFTLGVGNDGGYSTDNFNLFKSNLWVFLLAYKHLKVKPHDIVLNLNIGIRLYYPEIYDFLITDDCSYSGSQLVDSVLKYAIPEMLYHNKNTYTVIDKNQVMYQPVLDKKYNVHLLVPYVSSNALTKINNFENITGFNIIKYFSQIVNTYKNIFDTETIQQIDKLYKKFYSYVEFGDLTPLFFEHKIADMLSTIDLILIKGQVLDNPKKRQVFIDECVYDKNNPDKYDMNPNQESFNFKKIYCPSLPPYLEFQKYLI